MIVFLYETIKYIIMIIINRHFIMLYVNSAIYIYQNSETLGCKIQSPPNFR